MQRLSLAVFDIDGTLRVKRDPWIHLHECLGFGEAAHEHKRLFEAGEITYAEWGDRDAALWRGFSRAEILDALNTSPLRAGAQELLEWLSQHKVPLVGISTGLDVFNNVLAGRFAFRCMKSNQLQFDDNGICTGKVIIHVRENNKGEILKYVLHEFGISGGEVVALGDGSADIQLFEEAGLSIAVFPSRPEVRDAAAYSIEEGRLDAPAIAWIREHFSVGY
jgi:phosphoserine phosphatase